MPVEPNSLLQRITPCIHTHIRFCSKMEIFISSLAYHPHVSSENSNRKHIFSKTLSRVGFLKMLASRLRVDRQKWRFSNMLMSYIIFILLAWRMLRKGWSRISIVSAFLCGQAKMIWIRYVWMRIFFEKGGYPDACGWGHNRCIDHCKIFQDLVFQDTTLFRQYKFTLFAITHTSIPFLKPAVNPRMYFLIHGVK